MRKIKKLGPTLLVFVLAVCLLCTTALAATGTKTTSDGATVYYTYTEGAGCTGTYTVDDFIGHIGSNNCSSITNESISSITIPEGGDVTITTNGTSVAITVQTGGKLTIAGPAGATYNVVGDGGELHVKGSQQVNVLGTFSSITTGDGLSVNMSGADNAVIGGGNLIIRGTATAPGEAGKATVTGNANYGLSVTGGDVTMSADSSLKWADVSGGSLNLNGSTINNTSNDDNIQGRGLWVSGTGSVTGTANNGTDSIQGASCGIYVSGGSVNLTGYDISATTAGYALHSYAGSATFTNCNFNNDDKGVAVYVNNSGSVAISGAQISATGNNTAVEYVSTGTSTITNSNISGASDGVYMHGAGTLTISSTDATTHTITGNSESRLGNDSGSAIQVASGTLNITNMNLRVSNAAKDEALDPVAYVSGGTVSIEDSTIAPFGTNENVALWVAESSEGALTGTNPVTVTNTAITSYNPNNAVYINTFSSNTAPGSTDCDVTFKGTTPVDAAACETGVYMYWSGSFAATENTSIVADVYGVYALGNNGGNGVYAYLAATGTGTGIPSITVDSDNTQNVCYGMYGTGSDVELRLAQGVINATATADGDTAYGMYVTNLDNAATGAKAFVDNGVINATVNADATAYGVYVGPNSFADIDGAGTAITVQPRDNRINGATLEGIRNEGGTVDMKDGTVKVDAKDNGNFVYGLYNNFGTANFTGGHFVIAGGGSVTTRGIQNLDTVKFTGGSIEMTGDGSCAVYNAGNGEFEMGVHEQAALPETPGDLRHPYIKITYANSSYGLNNRLGSAKIFAGTMDITGNGAVGIYVDDGNVQVLANEHHATIDYIANTVVNVKVDGTDTKAFSVSSYGDWAIRGRGSVFTARTALDVGSASTNDGGLWHNANCADAQPATAAKSLSGGTFIGIMTVYDGYISDLILENHYLRDDSADSAYYNESSDGTRYVNTDSLESIGSRNTAYTVTDAEWELRYAMELDNDIDDYTLPISIQLDAYDELHGTGETDGDVDVSTGVELAPADAATNGDINGDGYHTLDLNGKILSATSDDNDKTNVESSATWGDINSVIEVLPYGKLITIASVRSAEDASPYNITGAIQYTGGNGVAVHVTGGVYQNGSAEADGVFPADGAILQGTDNGNNLRVDAGSATLNNGIVGWDNSSKTSVLINDGVLTVNSGYVYGNADGSDSIGILAEGGETTILGGTIMGDRQGYRAKDIHVNAADAQVLVSTGFAHNIGNVTVTAGRFDIDDGVYTVTDEEANTTLMPSTIRSLAVDGGSAYIHGGIISENSTVSAGELLADDGVFEKDLALTGGDTVFQNYPVIDVPEGTDPYNTWGTVKGTLSVTGSASLLVEYGDFGAVTTTLDGTTINLHGGLYGSISTTYTDNPTAVVNGEYIGGFLAGANKPGMIPANHYLATVNEDGAVTTYHRTDAASASVPTGRMEILALDVEELLKQTNVKLPCFVDLNGTENLDQDTYTFRAAQVADLTEGEIACDIACVTKAGGVWRIEAGESRTLDLNGYYITNSAAAEHVIEVAGALRISDTYTVPDGAVIEFAIQDNEQTTETIWIDGGSLTLTSGGVVNENEGDGRDGDAIYATGNATVTMSGGQIKSVHEDGITYNDGEKTASITVTGGEINAGCCGIYVSYSAAPSNVTVSVSGDAKITAKNNGIGYNGAGNVSVSGNAVITSEKDGIDYDGTGNVNVSGNAQITGADGYGLYYEGSGDVTISGGTFLSKSDSSDDAGLHYVGSGTLTISGGSFDNNTADEGFGVYVAAAEAVNISGGTFGKDSFGGLYVDDADAVSLTGGSYKSIVNAIVGSTLGNFISTNTTVTAESTTPKPSSTPKIEGNIDPSPAASDQSKVEAALKTNAPKPTTLVIPRDKYENEAEVSDNDNIELSLSAPVTVQETSSDTGNLESYTATVSAVYDYRSMFTLSTGGGFVPGPSGPTEPSKDPVLETEDHFAYVQGYPDGSFQPDGNLTRAEAASMFYRLLVDKSYTGAKDFSDVAATHWAYDAIQALASHGVIEGYPDGRFRPGGTITRAEFCAMSSRFFELTESKISFTDVPENYWAYAYIASAAGYGWIQDGETAFRPGEYITRAEAVEIVNNMLGRSADQSYVDANLSQRYTDVSKGETDAYYDIMEASVGHEYTKANDKETWTGLK